MKAGTRVNVMGVWATRRELCNVNACPLDHDDDGYHIVDEPREGRAGYVVVPVTERIVTLERDQNGDEIVPDGWKILRRNGLEAVAMVPTPEPEGRLSVLVNGTVLNVDAADVEVA